MPLSRRLFTQAAAASAAATAMPATTSDGKLAVLGGAPVRTEPFPAWPTSSSLEENALLDVLRSGKWFRGRGRKVGEFEESFARVMGSPHCLATANGTSALFTAMGGLEIGPGDEVLVPPYTFVATVNAVLLHHAVPVFVDTDRESFQMDAAQVEAQISGQTIAIVPVHLGGGACDLDRLTAIAKSRRLHLIEDACQSHLAEWKGRKAGTFGEAGCFSFQNSKNLTSGEGGAILMSDPELAERCYAFHNNGSGRKGRGGNGGNLRLTEFQGALLSAQMTRLEEQSRHRSRNAETLTRMLSEIAGITPAKPYAGCTRNAYHLYMFRYDPQAFGGQPKAWFLKALKAEGIPCSGGYTPLNKQEFLERTLNSRGFARIYGPNFHAKWRERNHCPQNDRLCEEAVWLTQNMLLGPARDMEQIAEAVRKVQKYAASGRPV